MTDASTAPVSRHGHAALDICPISDSGIRSPREAHIQRLNLFPHFPVNLPSLCPQEQLQKHAMSRSIPGCRSSDALRMLAEEYRGIRLPLDVNWLRLMLAIRDEQFLHRNSFGAPLCPGVCTTCSYLSAGSYQTCGSTQSVIKGAFGNLSTNRNPHSRSQLVVRQIFDQEIGIAAHFSSGYS